MFKMPNTRAPVGTVRKPDNTELAGAEAGHELFTVALGAHAYNTTYDKRFLTTGTGLTETIGTTEPLKYLTDFSKLLYSSKSIMESSEIAKGTITSEMDTIQSLANSGPVYFDISGMADGGAGICVDSAGKPLENSADDVRKKFITMLAHDIVGHICSHDELANGTVAPPNVIVGGIFTNPMYGTVVNSANSTVVNPTFLGDDISGPAYELYSRITVPNTTNIVTVTPNAGTSGVPSYIRSNMDIKFTTGSGKTISQIGALIELVSAE